MMYNFTKKCVLLFFRLGILILIIVSLLLFKLYEGPLSLEWVKNYIITHAKNNNIEAQIADIRLELDKKEKSVALKIEEAIFTDKENSDFMAKLPLIQLLFEAKKTSEGDNWLPSLQISNPEIDINPGHINISTFFNHQTSKSKFNINYFHFLRSLIIENGRLTFNNENRLIKIKAEMNRQNVKQQKRLLINVDINNAQLKLEIDKGHKFTDYNLQVANLPLALVTKIMNGNDENTVPIEQNANISSLNMLWTISSNQIVNIDKIALDFDNGGKLIALQEAKPSNNFAKNHSELKMTLSNIPMRYVTMLWPSWLGIEAKRWATSHILAGMITRGTLWADLCALQTECVDFKNLTAEYTPSMPIGLLRINNANLRYLEEYSPINNILGSISLDKYGLIINANKGMINKSNIEKVIVRVPYEVQSFPETNQYITINGVAEGPAVDLIEFIPEDNTVKASKDNIELKNILGKALTNVSIKIPMQEDIKFQDIVVDIKSQLKDIKLERLPNNAVLTQGEFDVGFDGKKTSVVGKGKLDNNALDVDWIGYIEEGLEHDTILKLRTEILAKNAKNIRVLDEAILKDGKVTVDTLITSKDNKTNINVTTDLKDIELGLSGIGFKKNIGAAAKGIMNAYTENDHTIVITKLLIEGDNISINGTGEFDKALLMPNRLNFSNMKFLNNNLMVDYKHDNQVITLNIQGEALDLNQVNFDKISNNKGSTTEFSDFSGKINLDKVVMKNNVIFNKLNGVLECKLSNCSEGHLFANMGKGNKNYFKILLTPKNSTESILTLEADNASLVLNAFGIYNNVTGGILLAYNSKKHDDLTKQSIFKGKILMQDFVAIKTPVLAKLLTFSSLPGIVRLLGGNSIAFKELTSDLKFSNGIFKIHEGNILGSELGLTMDGYIDINNKKINIEGTIVPELYSLNRTLAALPLIGYIMRESSKSKGVFAANYSIKGDLNNVNTSVNPISLFTPGIIKRIFTIFTHTKAQPSVH